MDFENVHDKFFKSLMGEKENAISFFRNYLPQALLQEMDLESLELQSESFVDEKLKESFSDVLHRVNIKNRTSYIYTLFDHKSKPDKYTSLQLLKYMISIWERHIALYGRKGKLPIVLPIVLYHGKRNWKLGNHLKVILETIPAYDPFIPDFRFSLYDLSKFSDEEIKGNIILQIAFHLMKNIFSPQLESKLAEIFTLFEELEDEDKALKWIEITLRYLFKSSSQITLDKLKKIAETTNLRGVESKMPSIAETLDRQGYERGFAKAIQFADLRAKREVRKKTLRTAIKLKESGAELSFISKITEMDKVLLERFFRKVHIV